MQSRKVIFSGLDSEIRNPLILTFHIQEKLRLVNMRLLTCFHLGSQCAADRSYRQDRNLVLTDLYHQVKKMRHNYQNKPNNSLRRIHGAQTKNGSMNRTDNKVYMVTWKYLM